MAHRSFGAVRRATQREAITFDFGVYGEETFTVIPDPSLGDCIELHDAPEPTPTNMLETARLLARFIRRMLAPEDRARFDAALFRIPSTELAIVVKCASWIAEQVSGFPTQPPEVSSSGRPRTGANSRPKPAGRARSKR